MKKVFAAVIAVLLIAVSTLPAFAAVSPTAEPPAYHLVADGDDGIALQTTQSTIIQEDGSQLWSLVAHGSDTTMFTGWTITGPYTFVKGSLSDENIVIRITGDVAAYAHGEPIVPGSSVPSSEPVEDTTGTGTTDSTSATSASEGQPTPTKGGGTDKYSGEKTVDKGEKSPQTGSSDSVVWIVLGLSAAAVLAGVIAVKRRSSDK